jgi:hypothetical protein
VSVARDSASLVAALTSPDCPSRRLLLTPHPPGGFYQWPSLHAIQSAQLHVEAQGQGRVVVRCPSDATIFHARSGSDTFTAKGVEFQVRFALE